MKKILSLTIFIVSAFSLFGQNEVDSLLKVLDKTINLRPQYTEEKELHIGNLKKQLFYASTDEQKYEILGQLFDQYKGYQMDSALNITNQRLTTAERQGIKKNISVAQMNLSEIMGMTGMYKEALDILEKQDRKAFDREQLLYYYHLYHSIYVLMTNYSISENEKIHYEKLTYQYKDSILQIIPSDDIGYAMVKSNQLLAIGNYEQALDIASKCYHSIKEDNHSTAIISYILSEIYGNMGNPQLEKKHLAISSINDLREGVKEYIALRKLAILLYEEGDIDRAYNYMKCSMEDAIFCNARLRTLEISQMLPIINATYDLKTKKEHNRLVILLIIISVLSCILIGATLYIYKQLKTLSRIRKSLKKMNESLKSVNDDLNNVNSKLSESNHVKEEYIGYLFNMCSTYIDKLEDFRVKVSRKLKTGQLDDLNKMASSSSLMTDELKEFYKNFDTIFLNLYPDFVNDFNSLLIPNERITPKEGELLTPELRIFALVRLGINDSVKIADFLHYSSQTVYNYRLKVRNKAIVSKEDFSVAVNQIGQIKR